MPLSTFLNIPLFLLVSRTQIYGGFISIWLIKSNSFTEEDLNLLKELKFSGDRKLGLNFLSDMVKANLICGTVWKLTGWRGALLTVYKWTWKCMCIFKPLFSESIAAGCRLHWKVICHSSLGALWDEGLKYKPSARDFYGFHSRFLAEPYEASKGTFW